MKNKLRNIIEDMIYGSGLNLYEDTELFISMLDNVISKAIITREIDYYTEKSKENDN